MKCDNCKWGFRGNNGNYSCGYCMIPGHSFKLIELEKKLGRVPLAEELSLIVPPQCLFFEERKRKK